jgi:beta-mannanase
MSGAPAPSAGRARRIAVGAVVLVASAALFAPIAAASAQQPARTVGITMATHQHTDAKGRVTEQLASLRPWEAATRTRVQVRATFISWGNGVDPVAFARAVAAQGATPMITWESWASWAPKCQTQPAYTNAKVAAGRWDPYLRRVARGLKTLNQLTYIRFDHEMNGDWYPWHDDPSAYVAAWRHVVDVFRQENATNVKWIWAPNATSWTTDGWLDGVRPYWPGEAYVDYIGLTVQERYATMDIYGQHLDLIHATWPTKQIVLPETNAMTPPYMHALVTFVSTRPWITNVTWYEQRDFGALLTTRRWPPSSAKSPGPPATANVRQSTDSR